MEPGEKVVRLERSTRAIGTALAVQQHCTPEGVHTGHLCFHRWQMFCKERPFVYQARYLYCC